jgi:branched-chain amino acid aminotransferase
MPLVFFENRFVDSQEPLIKLDDRSFRFGDGLFETILVVKGKIYDYESHIERLKKGLEFFKIDYEPSKIKNICKELIEKNHLETGYLRLIISRGINPSGAIGYKARGSKPYLIVQSIEKALPEFQTLKLWISSHRAFYHFPSKLNSAFLYTLSMIEADENNRDNALILDSKENICETANANIFWFKGDTLCTPSLELALIPGTIRKKLLEIYEGQIEEAVFKLEDLNSADEVFLTNISYLIAGVSEINPLDLCFSKFEKTQKLRKSLLDKIQGDCLL